MVELFVGSRRGVIGDGIDPGLCSSLVASAERSDVVLCILPVCTVTEGSLCLDEPVR